MRFKSLAMIAGLCALTISGCAYRADLVQGNFVEQEAVDQLRYGMSAEQVRFILGTPMLIDPFDSSRWYYVHYLREGWGDPQIKNLIVLFSGSTLIDLTGDFDKPLMFDSGINNFSKLSMGDDPTEPYGAQNGNETPASALSDEPLTFDEPDALPQEAATGDL